MRIEVLMVPECPNGPLIEQRLAAVLAGRPDVSVDRRVAGTAAQAEMYGMHGSPTVLIEGRDPFAGPGTGPSLSCRLYRDDQGRVQGAPSVAQLRAALATAERGADEAPAAVGRGGRGRRAPAEGGLRAVHQAVLRSFAETGRAPDPAVLEAVATRDNAEVFAAQHPEARGRILGQQEARTLGEEIFGPLLAADT